MNEVTYARITIKTCAVILSVLAKDLASSRGSQILREYAQDDG